MAQAPGTPTKNMKEFYQGTPIVGSPAREKKLNATDVSVTNPTCVEIAKVSLLEFTKNNRKISVKGTVEKSATLGKMLNTPGKIVEFFAVNLVDDVSSFA